MSFAELDGDRILPRDVVGHLLLVWSVEYIDDAPSQYPNAQGKSDAVAVDVVDLDQVDDEGQPGLLARNVWWRPGKLISKLKRLAGNPDPVLAFMTQGTASKGFNAPFELVMAHSDAQCRARGEAWMAAHPDFKPSRPYQKPEIDERYIDSVPQYRQPPVVPYSPPPPPPPPVATASATMTTLERLAKQAQQGAARHTPPDHEEPPF